MGAAASIEDDMMRNALFWGLTLVLAVVLVSLVIKSRHQANQPAPGVVEVVKESKPTPTRVIEPRDLKIVDSKMELAAAKGGTTKEDDTAIAHHRIKVRNDGSAAYASVLLKITYLGRNGRALDSKISSASDPIPPGETVSLGEITVEGVPAEATHCSIEILSADLK
jgi:hypothetical protein